MLIVGLLIVSVSQVLCPPRIAIVINNDQIEGAIAAWQRRYERPATALQRQQIKRQVVQEHVLVAEALRRGFASLPPVQHRIQQLTEIVGSATSEQNGALHAQILANDTLIQRYLTDALKADLGHQLTVNTPTSATIAAYAQTHPQMLVGQPMRQVSQVFFADANTDAGEDSNTDLLAASDTNVEAHARQARQTIIADKLSLPSAVALGDSFYGGHQLAPKTQLQLSAVLSEPVAAVAFDSPPHRWSRPLASPYGWHLIRVNSVLPAIVRPRIEVEQAITRTLMEASHAKQLEAAIDDIAANYSVSIIADQSLTPPNVHTNPEAP